MEYGPHGFKSLKEGESVEYNITLSGKGYHAVDVTGRLGRACEGVNPVPKGKGERNETRIVKESHAAPGTTRPKLRTGRHSHRDPTAIGSNYSNSVAPASNGSLYSPSFLVAVMSFSLMSSFVSAPHQFGFPTSTSPHQLHTSSQYQNSYWNQHHVPIPSISNSPHSTIYSPSSASNHHSPAMQALHHPSSPSATGGYRPYSDNQFYLPPQYPSPIQLHPPPLQHPSSPYYSYSPQLQLTTPPSYPDHHIFDSRFLDPTLLSDIAYPHHPWESVETIDKSEGSGVGMGLQLEFDKPVEGVEER
jgi:hypothetical protein